MGRTTRVENTLKTFDEALDAEIICHLRKLARKWMLQFTSRRDRSCIHGGGEYLGTAESALRESRTIIESRTTR